MIGSLAFISLLSSAFAGLEQLDHVVIFMQENRAFDHYFATLAGVRGFQDPNVPINPNGKSQFYQDSNSTLSQYLLPFPINYKGDNTSANTHCEIAGSNDYESNHFCLNQQANGTILNNVWPQYNTPVSMSHFTREGIPVQFSCADQFVVGDMYQEGVMGASYPNRATLMSGTINLKGSPPLVTQGGPYLVDTIVPGCAAEGPYESTQACFPLSWKTVPEYLQDANVTWRVYSTENNLNHNALVYFDQFRNAAVMDPTGPLSQRGMQMTPVSGLSAFLADAAAGTLPAVSYYIAPAELSEHPPFSPIEGGWLHSQMVNAIVNSPKYNRTAMIVSYDETGGWSDHVIPMTSPAGTVGEWSQNPYANISTFSGPGFRVPFYVVSPFTRVLNGLSSVFTEMADHNSQILFIENFVQARFGKDVRTPMMNPWRREHMSNLSAVFDWTALDTRPITLPFANDPYGNNTLLEGDLAGFAACAALASVPNSVTVPYGKQTEATALWVESGSRRTRGYLTEGRHLVFESTTNGLALSVSSSTATIVTSSISPAIKQSNALNRFVIHYDLGVPVPKSNFKISVAGIDGTSQYLSASLSIGSINSAATFSIAGSTVAGGMTYTVQEMSTLRYLSIADGAAALGSTAMTFNVYSVTF